MPVLEARGEAEALCAQLNYEGHVDACITADSDAFLFGSSCVIKCIHPNSRVSCCTFSPVIKINYPLHYVLTGEICAMPFLPA